MQYILFMILLTTAPGQSTPKPKRLYALQATQAIEFDTKEACIFAHDDIERSVSETDTVVIVSACYQKGGGEHQAAAEKSAADRAVTDKAVTDKSVTEKKLRPPSEGVVHFKTFKCLGPRCS